MNTPTKVERVEAKVKEFEAGISSCALTESNCCCGEVLSKLLITNWLRTTLTEALTQNEARVRETTIEDIFSGKTVEYQGKFFKISDGDAFNFIKWKESSTPKQPL